MAKTSLPVALTTALLLSTATIAANADDPPRSERSAVSEWSGDGLQRVNVPGVEIAFVNPAAKLSEYSRVMLRPVEVSIDRNWGADATGTRLKTSNSSNTTRVRERLAQMVAEEMTKELTAGGYTIAQAAGPDVLEIDIDIENVRVAAPSGGGSGYVRTYASSGAEMTLVAALRDSETGAPAMRFYDRKAAKEDSQLSRIDNYDNANDARLAASIWARAVRSQLDAAQAAER